MLEWLKRHAWKACRRQKCHGGSNPPLSAKTVKGNQLGFPFFMPINQEITNVTAS